MGASLSVEKKATKGEKQLLMSQELHPIKKNNVFFERSAANRAKLFTFFITCLEKITGTETTTGLSRIGHLIIGKKFSCQAKLAKSDLATEAEIYLAKHKEKELASLIPDNHFSQSEYDQFKDLSDETITSQIENIIETVEAALLKALKAQNSADDVVSSQRTHENGY